MGLQSIQPRIAPQAITDFVSSSQSLQEERLLTSWKEIAAFFGKGVRTVQRWEQKLGLPILRPNSRKGIVIAKATELENWIKRNSVSTGGRISVRTANNSSEDLQLIKELADQISDLAHDVQAIKELADQISGIAGKVSRSHSEA